MEVSVETLNGLNRRITVSIPAERVEKEVDTRLRKLVTEVELDGFRRGKAPLSLVKKRYSETVRGEVAQRLLESTLYEALGQTDLKPVASPAVDEFKLKVGEDFQYAVSFEVYPAIDLREPDKKTKLEVLTASIQDKDVDQMIEKLREQNKAWKKTDHAVKEGNQVVVDFKGFIGEEAFDKGEAQGHRLEIGAKQMIPGFEEALIGHKPGESFSIEVTFPKDYHEDLAGKEARFDIHLHEVLEGGLPALDKEFVKRFGIQSGEIEDLKKDIKQHMERELDRRLKEINHEACFAALMQVNEVELPLGLINKEIESLKHEMYHQIFGPKHVDNEKIPDFPRELFEDRAKKRVCLGLLFSEYIKKHSIVADNERVETMIKHIAAAYDDPKAFMAQCQTDKHMMAEIEAMVVESMVADRIRENVTVNETASDYEQVMNKKPNREEGEAA